MVKITILSCFILQCHWAFSYLMCYECKALMHTNDSCATLKFTFSTSCDQRDYLCVKYVIRDLKTKQKTVYRDCSKAGTCDQMETKYAKDSTVLLKQCIECDENICNSATVGTFNWRLWCLVYLFVRIFVCA